MTCRIAWVLALAVATTACGGGSSPTAPSPAPSGSVTVTAYTPPTPGVEGSGAIEGIFTFTLVPPGATQEGPGRTRVMTNGRFGTRFTFGF